MNSSAVLVEFLGGRGINSMYLPVSDKEREETGAFLRGPSSVLGLHGHSHDLPSCHQSQHRLQAARGRTSLTADGQYADSSYVPQVGVKPQGDSPPSAAPLTSLAVAKGLSDWMQEVVPPFVETASAGKSASGAAGVAVAAHELPAAGFPAAGQAQLHAVLRDIHVAVHSHQHRQAAAAAPALAVSALLGAKPG